MNQADLNDSMPNLPAHQPDPFDFVAAQQAKADLSIASGFSPRRFHQGDKVVCVDNTYLTSTLKLGEEYEVDADYGDVNGKQCVYLVGDTDNCPYAASRFKLASPERLTPTQAAEVRNWDSAEERGVPTPEPGDEVNLPSHYARFKIEPIRFLVENFGPSILVGKIVKYSMRYDGKNGLQDIDKAIRCAQMLRAYVAGDSDWWQRKASA